MSASPANNDENETDEIGPAAAASSNNPFLVAAVGMALLSSDPAVTLAAQSARDAVFPGAATSAPPVLMVSAATPTKGDPALKDLLGEVSSSCGRLALFGWCFAALVACVSTSRDLMLGRVVYMFI